MACRQFSAKPLSDLMLDYSSNWPLEKFKNSEMNEMHLNMSSAKWCPLYRASMSRYAPIYFNIYYMNSTCTKGAMYRFLTGGYHDSGFTALMILQVALYCHIDTWFVTNSLWICHYELLYIYGINDVWILNLESSQGDWVNWKHTAPYIV